MHAKPYPKYKPSGVEWLGDVPEHWDVKRLKNAAAYRVSNVDKISADDEIPVRLCNYTDVYYNEEIHSGMELMEASASPEEISRFRLQAGDVVITKDSEEWNDIAIPAIVRESAPDMVCGYHLAIIRPLQGKIFPQFLLRAMQATAINQQFQMAATGVTRYGVPKTVIGEAWISIPSYKEQRSIANFLDRETGKIDRLVTNKRKLIERLKDKRAALISRTVTHGMPQDIQRAYGVEVRSKLKSSGIDWLGSIPEHWSVIAYKRLCSRVDVGIAEAATHAYCDDGVAIIRSTNVKPNFLDTREMLRIEPWFAEKNKAKTLRAGDLVTVRTGYPGTTAVIPKEFDGAQCFTLVLSSPKSETHGPFFSYILNSGPGRSYFEKEGWGTAQTNISVPIVQMMPVPCPPLEEQRAITRYLDSETAKMDRMVATVEDVIKRLQEYRTALISAAVTGKIDVRTKVADNMRDLASTS